ncbi:PREDICTED: E3 ubiquitin-protein ligase TRIM71-like [Acropora digitifera]|uniref:E3 ubiquitin-protein ligase TRIM71-like n=1 Tax=Acropora digitifera TaxID=70779 RepID=UPI00077A6F72|nr:PREDICTED: E3 ubiquitin-protein ligase TRIM71-like [Acropora digitifera]
MAHAVPTVTSTNETTNFARLCRLLVDVATQALRDTFDSIHSSNDLHKVLSANCSTLKDLKSKRIINPIQWGKLFPPIPTTVSSKDFDTTLLVVLLRNICGLAPPTSGWDNLPIAEDLSLEADIARLKYFRNEVYAHAEMASVDEVTFNTYWRDIRETVVRLGGNTYQAAVDRLKDECMDPRVQEHYRRLLVDWKRDDDNLKEKIDEIMRKLKALEEIPKERPGRKFIHLAQGCSIVQTRHNQHPKEDIQQVAEEIKSQRREILAKAEEQISIIEANIKEQNRLMEISEQEVVDAKNMVATSVERFVQRLREHEVKTREKLNSINKTQQREYQKRLEELQSSASRLKSAIDKDKDLLQQRGGVEILEIENKDFNVQEEELNNVRMEIYKARHVDYVWNDRTSKDVKTSCHILEDQIIVTHTDVSQTTVEGRGLGEVELEATAEFIITTRDSEGRQVYDKDDRVDVIITCIKTENSKDIVEDCKDGTYIVRYSPISAGSHRVAIEVNGRPLTASPWLVQVTPHRYKDVDRFCGNGLSAFVFPWSVAVNERTGQMAIACYSSKRIQLFDKEWKYEKTIGGDSEFQRQRGLRNALDIGHPISVAFLRNDDIVFSRERIEHKEQMSVFTAQGEFINRFSDHLVRPLSVFVKTEDDGQVIVSDVGDKKIKVLSPDGKDLLQSFSPPDCQETAEFIVYHNRLFFASYQREHCVKVFNNEGTYLYDIGRADVPVGQELRNPVGVTVDKFNQVIICDNGNCRVQAFTVEGHFLYSITDEMHMIESPWFAAVIGDGDKLLVTDVAVGTHCIYVFM